MNLKSTFREQVLRLANLALSPPVVWGLMRVSGHTPGVFASRLSRLWQLGRALAHSTLTPPLPVRLQVETTDICNLKCRMCPREVLEDLDTGTMSIEQFVRLLEATKPFYVTLNGLGEPLIDKTIFEKLAYLHERQITTSMPTNGTFVTGAALDKLVRNFPDRLSVSIDGATAESFNVLRRPARFDKVIENVLALIAGRSRDDARPGNLQVLFALQKRNLAEFEETYELIKVKLRPDSFALIPVHDYDPEGPDFADVVPTRDDVLHLHRTIEERLAEITDAAKVEFFNAWKHASSTWLSDSPSVVPETNTHACAVPTFSSYIDAKGRVYPCCYLVTSDHVMGNVNNEPFEKIWHGQTYRAFRRDLMTDRPHLDGCRTCPRNDDGLLATARKYASFLPPPRADGRNETKTGDRPNGKRRLPMVDSAVVR